MTEPSTQGLKKPACRAALKGHPHLDVRLRPVIAPDPAPGLPKVTKSNRALAVAKEPDRELAPSWLDPDSRDDRLLAACLELQGDRPEAALILVTGDLNLQNKADAVGLPYVEPPLLTQ